MEMKVTMASAVCIAQRQLYEKNKTLIEKNASIQLKIQEEDPFFVNKQNLNLMYTYACFFFSENILYLFINKALQDIKKKRITLGAERSAKKEYCKAAAWPPVLSSMTSLISSATAFSKDILAEFLTAFKQFWGIQEYKQLKKETNCNT